MSIASTASLILIATGAIAATAVFVYFVVEAEESPFRQVLGRYESHLESHTRFLLMSHSGSRIARLQLVLVGATSGVGLVSRSLLWVLIALLLALLPPFLLSRRHAQRLLQLERQLDAWLLMLSNSLKATPSIGDAIASTLSLVPRPFADEVDLLVKEIRLGAPLHRAVNAMARRVNSPSISGALATIVVASQTGGNLPRTLEGASASLRESTRLDGVLRAKTAEGRGQVLLLASMPFLLFGLISWLDRSWFEPVLQDVHGRLILTVCATLWLTASIWAHRIVRVEL